MSVLLLLLAVNTEAFVVSRHASVHTSTTTTLFATTTTTNATDAAQQLLDKAAQLRAEIAAMEGKTVEQVTLEAQQKKQEEASRRELQQMENSKRQQERVSNQDPGRTMVQLPTTVDDMIRQASRAVERAFKDGKTRQTVRFHLVEDGELLQEENQWPGGAQQMYREAAKPMTTSLLRELSIGSSSNVAPKIIEQDIWDFDGSALHTAEASAGPSEDVQALVFANTDVKYINDIAEISKAMGPDRLFLLVNPFWRNLDSWSFNLLAPNAKSKAQQVIFNDNDPTQKYDETYVNLVFQVRGEKCIAIKAYPYDWQVFAMREDDVYGGPEYAIRLGSCAQEPTSALVTQWLNERPEFKETKTMRQFKKFWTR